MATLDSALANIQKAVPECVATGVVELKSGMLLGIRTVDSHPREVIDLLAAATSDIFQGPNVVMIEKMFKRIRGAKDDDHHYFQEIIVSSDNLLHVFLRGKKNEDVVICVVCRASANLGMVLAKFRALAGSVEQTV